MCKIPENSLAQSHDWLVRSLAKFVEGCWAERVEAMADQDSQGGGERGEQVNVLDPMPLPMQRCACGAIIAE